MRCGSAVFGFFTLTYSLVIDKKSQFFKHVKKKKKSITITSTGSGSAESEKKIEETPHKGDKALYGYF